MRLGASINFINLNSGIKRLWDLEIKNFEFFYWFFEEIDKDCFKKTKELFQTFGGNLYSIHLPEYSIEKKEFLMILEEKIIEVANNGLNPRLFVLHPPKKHEDWIPAIRNLNHLKDLIQNVYSKNTEIVIENMPNSAFSNERSFNFIFNNFKFPCTIDFTHFYEGVDFKTGDITDKLLRVLKLFDMHQLLAHLHLSDISNTNVGYQDPFHPERVQTYHLPPGKGIYDWERIIKFLDTIKYKGVLMIECLSIEQTIEGYMYLKKLSNQI